MENISPSEKISTIKVIEKVTIWIMVLSALTFALVSILAIWGVFSDADEIAGRSLSTIAVIAFAALVIHAGARMLESKKK